MRTLLLVDDSVTIQRVIELTFAGEHIRVVSVGDGRRALQWLEREGPDVVLADVAAPEVDGYALTTFIRESARLRRVPVVLLAGAFEPVDESRARQVGADAVLVKPFEPEELVTRVRSLLERADADRSDGAADAARARRAAEPESGSVVTPFPAMPRPAAPQPGVAAAGAVQAAPDVAATPAPDAAVAAGWPVAAAVAAGERRDAPLPPRVALANAFSALLAAEQALPAAAPPPPASVLTDAMVEQAVRKALTDGMVEQAIRRALTRMTENIVRRIVVETAERLIREEIEKIKSSSE